MAAIWLEWISVKKIHTKAINERSRVMIGRMPDCDIYLEDPHISRNHALVNFDDGIFKVRNLSETNPIILNDRWQIDFNQNSALRPGDMLTLGKIEIRVAASQSPSGRRQAPVIFKVRCPGCDRVLESDLVNCPWCQASLAGAEALIFHPEERK